jgi:serine/threonine protein kinase
MATCPSCSRSVPERAVSCPACGAALLNSWTPTRLQPAERHADPHIDIGVRHQAEHLSSTSSTNDGRFIAGVVLADRYRIVSLLGRGGMGEVYKAEDLKLEQTVALKFLPDAIARDADVLTRFRNEVRVTRQISHPNVCRVYDIAEVEGRHFLSMEFIDGEDLSSLLRRIGRLPGGSELVVRKVELRVD